MEHGEPVRVAMTKWGDRPHWEYDAVYLGIDEHGDWLGLRAGTRLERPGAAFDAETDQVVLVPREQWWVATFHAPGYHVATYVDMTSPPVWGERGVGCVDLDLDVVRRADGTVYIDDEDEFAEHRELYGYPPETVAGAEGSCAWVYDAVVGRSAPFDDATHRGWLARIPR